VGIASGSLAYITKNGSYISGDTYPYGNHSVETLSWSGIVNAGDVFQLWVGSTLWGGSNRNSVQAVLTTDVTTTIAEVDFGTQLCKYDGYTSSLSGDIKFTTRSYNYDGGGDDTAYLIEDDNTGSFTKFTAIKDCYFDIAAYVQATAGSVSLAIYLRRYNSLGVKLEEYIHYSQEDNAAYAMGTTTTAPFRMSKGEYATVARVESDSAPNGAWVAIKATPLRAEALVAIPRKEVAIIKDIKNDSTNGGTFTSGAWRQRVLTDLSGDTSFVSLIGNQIILKEGRYFLRALVPATSVDQHQAKLRNYSDGTDTLLGSKGNSSSTSTSTDHSVITGMFEIASFKIFEIQHRCGTTKADNGFGSGTSAFGVSSIYTQVEITKLR